MGHWGVSAAARRGKPFSSEPSFIGVDRGQELAAIPRTAECANCESSVVLAGEQLPKGWVVVEGQALCPDCAPPQPPGALKAAIAESSAKEKSVAMDMGESRYRGCRIGHETAFGVAALQIRAGAKPPAGRDETVNFILDAHGLDELIIELSAIRAELTDKGKSDG